MEIMGVIDESFWKGKRVFITGHTGFKGSWLTLWLTSLGAHVAGFSLSVPTKPSMFEVIGLENDVKLEHILGDARELSRLLAQAKRFEPDIIFHLAAQSLVRGSYLQPVETYQTNVMGTVNVLEAIRQVRTVRAGVTLPGRRL